HHERQPPVSVQGMPVMEVKNGLLFPIFEPEVARHFAVMLVDFAVAVPPGVKLAGADPQPADELLGRQFGALLPVIDVIHYFVADIVGNPDAFQRSPNSFFNCTCSCINSATTSFFFASCSSCLATFASRLAIFWSF